MTTITIDLPDQLAAEAAKAGLLANERMEALLREELRSERIARMQAARAKLAADPVAPMTSEEIQAEIRAYRTERKRATGT